MTARPAGYWLGAAEVVGVGAAVGDTAPGEVRPAGAEEEWLAGGLVLGTVARWGRARWLTALPIVVPEPARCHQLLPHRARPAD